MNSKEMLKRANKEKRTFFRNDRQKMEVIKDVFVKDKTAEEGKRKTLSVGQIINPHILHAEQFELDGIAKAI